MSCIFDNASLTEKGATRIESVYGCKPVVDVYASIANNPFNIQYASRHQSKEDPNFLHLDGPEFLASSKFDKLSASGYLYFWPPLDLLDWTVSFLINRSHSASLSCVLVVPSHRASIIYQGLLGFRNIHMFSIQKPREKSHTVNCKNENGLAVIGFGPNMKPDFGYRTHLKRKTSSDPTIRNRMKEPRF